MGHAYHHESNPKEYEEFSANKDELHDLRWDNREEKWTIKNIENPVAKELKESVRTWHNTAFTIGHKLVVTAGPTTVTPGVPVWSTGP